MKKSIKSGNNYLKLAIIIIIVVFVTVSASNLYRGYETNKTKETYLSKYVLNVQHNELNNTNIEFSSDTFVILSYSGDKDVYYLEKNLKKVIDNYNIIDNVVYVDMTTVDNKNEYLKFINEAIILENKNIKDIPAIIYYKDTVPTNFIDSSEGLINASNFAQLLDQYEIDNR